MKANKPVIFLGSDHAGYRLKEAIKEYLDRSGYPIRDLGAHSDKASDYPDFILPAAEEVARSRGRAMGIVFGGSGLGECIAANKVRGIRAVAAYDAYTTHMSRLHNDANVLCLGGRTVTGRPAAAWRLVRIWLKTRFSGESRHVRRLKKIAAYERTRRIGRRPERTGL